MAPLRKFIWQPLLWVFLLAASCTIIEDGDITSVDQILDSELTAFEIVQKTGAGESTVTATFNYDSVQNFVDPNTGTRIVRKIEFTIPALSFTKLKYRSGATGAMKMYVYYTDTKKVYTVGIVSGSTVVELYRFRYNSSGQLYKVVTIMNPGQTTQAGTSDSLTFESASRIAKFIRTTEGSCGEYQVIYRTHDDYQVIDQISRGNSCGSGSGVVFSACGSGSGGNGSSADMTPLNACYQRQNSPNQFSNAQLYILVDEISNHTFRLRIKDNRIGSRDGDTYYFHPLMVLRKQVQFGDDLFRIYMHDWWQANYTTTNPSTGDEMVTINYKYRVQN